MKSFWIVLLHFSILISVSLLAVSSDAPPSKLYFDHLTIREGLSHNSVYAILQDKYGYIWVGTQNGLNKYDSYSFEILTSSEDSLGFQGKTINTLFEDSKGRLWVGTSRYGINLRESAAEHFINLNDDPSFEAIRDKEINNISEDSQGNIYIATHGAGLLRFNPESKETKQFKQVDGLTSDVVFDVQEDKLGRIWIACPGPGLNYLTQDGIIQHLNYSTKDSPNLNGYRKKLTIEEDYIWLSTEGTGFYKIDLSDFSFQHFATFSADHRINTNSVKDILRSDDGLILIATDGAGLYVFDEEKDELVNYTHVISASMGLNSNALLNLLKDKEGNIWIGTYNGGINIHTAHKTWFEHYSPETAIGYNMSNPSVLSIAEVGNEIFLGTDGGGVNFIDSSGELRAEDLELPSKVVKSILEDSSGNTWLGLFPRGIYRINKDKSTRSYFSDPNEPNTACGNVIWSISEAKNGDIWIGSLDKGICIYNPRTDAFSSAEEYGISDSEFLKANVMCIFTDSKDRIWIGTTSDGLLLYDRIKGLKHYRQNKAAATSISSNEVRAIYEDSRGNIWIGTESGGLNKWNADETFSTFGKADGLIDNSAMAITEDDLGYLWISSFQGLSRTNQELSEVKNFNFRSNEKNNQFNQQAILKAKNGKLYFGGINGLNVIDPNNIKSSDKNHKISFTALKIFGEKVNYTNDESSHSKLNAPIEEATDIYLDHTDNSFTIEFSAFDFGSPEEVSYKYMMEDFDESWRETKAGLHFASYTNLDPGRYKFMVKNKSEIRSINVKIKPPFYKTALFRILSLLLILGLVYFGLQFWNNKVEADHKQQLLKIESENLQLRNEKLAADLNAKNSKLMFSSVQMAHKNDILRDLKDELKSKVKENANPDLKKLLRNIDSEIKGEDYWQEFNIYFEQTDHEFINSLIKKHPKLTQNDLRLCSLLRLRLSTKEIASLLNISVRGVEQSRYRLKKRLEIVNGEDLVKYIASLDSQS